jgi:hypothetical protein
VLCVFRVSFVWTYCLYSLYLVLKLLQLDNYCILFIPLLLYLSVSCFLGWRWFCIVFFVLYAILIFVFLNSLIMVLVSLPYMNVTHFCFCVVLSAMFLLCFPLEYRRVCGEYWLFCSTAFIICNSLCLLSVEMGYVFTLLIRYLTAEFLCSVWWHAFFCIIRLVVVDFLYILQVNELHVFSMVMSHQYQRN